MKTIRQFWEERSKKYGYQIEGVLPKSFPRFVNNYLDKWMYEQVKGAVSGAHKILDLGCGYGRLAEKILRDFPKSRVVGIDLSQHYVDLFNQSLAPQGEAVKGDIRNLPLADASFDAVVMVTTLMYLAKTKDQERAVKEMFRVLRPGGSFVVIERNPGGHNVLMLGGLVAKLRGPKKREIPAVSFAPAYLKNLLKKNGGVVTKVRGVPSGLTVSLYIAYSGLKKK